jgi:hypothetical protein
VYLRANEETDEVPTHQIKTQQYLQVVISFGLYSIFRHILWEVQWFSVETIFV